MRQPVKANGRKSADEQLAAALAAGSRIVDAATTAGVSESTVYRRLKNDNFRAGPGWQGDGEPCGRQTRRLDE